VSAGKLTFAIVPDIAVSGAHDDAVKPYDDGTGLDFVVHTASPFHMDVTEPKSQMLDPAVQGTRGLLESVKKFAPTVKRVVVTSSFASILNGAKLSPPWPGKVYTEEGTRPLPATVSVPYIADDECDDRLESNYLGERGRARQPVQHLPWQQDLCRKGRLGLCPR